MSVDTPVDGVPSGTPEEFQSDVEVALVNEYPPEHLRTLRRHYSDGIRSVIRRQADEDLADDIENREAYVDALVAAFDSVLNTEGER